MGQNKREEFDKTKALLENVGPGFCAAKWYNATIWLSNGRTASCHHPIAHTVPESEVLADPSALHNTVFKKEQRHKMLVGERPEECGYCWRVEDADKSQLSDRTFKSHIYSHKDILALTKMPWNTNVDLKTLEISFDHLCNLSCSYCNSEFSSTWANDIKTNGSYDGMKTNGGFTYRQAYEFKTDPAKEENIYVKKFFEWWNSSLRNNLSELRITGGEPSRSPHFWKFVEQCRNEKFKFSVNSNLQMDEIRLDKLIECSKQFDDFEIYTSCETHGKFAEFVRSGLNYETWLKNIERFAVEASYTHVNVMMTISAVALFGMTDFLDDIVKLKNKFNNKTNFHLSVNILRFPSFQSVNVLPSSIKMERASALSSWINKNRQYICDDEIAGLERLVSYLTNIDRSYEDGDSYEHKCNDFKNFFTTYSKRRHIDIQQLFSKHDAFLTWFNNIT